MEGKCGVVGCRWQAVDVTRPLNSVSEITGPPEGPGRPDVIFSNRCCYVVPPGIVDEIVKSVKPVAEYPRQGGLYIADVALTSFARQGREQ